MNHNFFLIVFFAYVTLVSSSINFNIYESIFHFNGFGIDDLKRFSSFQSLKDTQTPIIAEAFTNLFQSSFKYLDIVDVELSGLSKESPDTVIFTGQIYIDNNLDRDDIIDKINKNGPLAIFKLSRASEYTYLHKGRIENNPDSYVFEDQLITFGTCQNGGILLPNNTCECKDYFSGSNCQKVTCLNSGIPTANGRCICPPGFISPHCGPIALTQPTQYSFDFTDKSFIYVINLRDSMSEDIQYIIQNTKNLIENTTTITFKNFILTTYVSNHDLLYNFMQSKTYTSLNDFITALESITFVYGDIEQPTLSAISNTLSTQTTLKSRSNMFVYCDSVSTLSTGYNISQVATNSLEYNITLASVNWNIRVYFSLTSSSNYPLNKTSDGYLVYARIASSSFGQFFDFTSSKANVASFSGQVLPYLLPIDVIAYGSQVSQVSFRLVLNTSDDSINLMIVGGGKLINQSPTITVSSVSIYTLSKADYVSLDFQSTGTIDYSIFGQIKNTMVPGFTAMTSAPHSDVDVYSFTLINEFPMKPVMYGNNIASSTMTLQSTSQNSISSNLGSSTQRNGQQLGMFNYIFTNQISTCTIGNNIINVQYMDSTSNSAYTRIFPTLCLKPYDSSLLPITCQNGGTLNAQGNGCICAPSYVGKFCETPLCYNGGSVNRYPTGANDQCLCVDGFSGIHCEKDSCDGQQNPTNFDVSHKTMTIVMANVSSQAYLSPIISLAIQEYMVVANNLNINYTTQFVLTTYSNMTDIISGNSSATTNTEMYTFYGDLIDRIITNRFPISPSASQNSIEGLHAAVSLEIQYNRKSVLFWFVDQFTVDSQNDLLYQETQMISIANQIPINVIFSKPYNLDSTQNISICATGNNDVKNKISQLAYTTGGVVLDLCTLSNTTNIQNLFTTFGQLSYNVENVYQTNLQQCSNNQVTKLSFSSTDKKFVFISSNTQDSVTLSVSDSNGIPQQVNGSISTTPNIFLFDVSSLQKNIPYTFSVTSQNQAPCMINIMEESDISTFMAFSKSVAINYDHATPDFGIPYHPVIHLSKASSNQSTIELSDVIKTSNGAYDSIGFLRSSSCSYDFFYDAQYACKVPNSPFYLTATVSTVISPTETLTVQRSILSYCKGPVSGGCLNNGVLNNGTCVCPYNYIGQYCEKPLCYNGGTSVQNQCQCPKNYFGTFCQYVGCDAIDYKTLSDVNKFSYNTIIFVVENTNDSINMNSDLITNIPTFINTITQKNDAKEFVLITVDDINNNNIIITPDPSYFVDIFTKTLSTPSSPSSGRDVKTISGLQAALQYSLYKPTIIYVFTTNGASDKSNVYTAASKIGDAFVQINYIYVPTSNVGTPSIPQSTKYMYTQLLSYGSGGRLIPINSGSDLASLILNYLPSTVMEDGIVEDKYVDDASTSLKKLFFPVENQTEWFTISITGKAVNNATSLNVYNGNGKLVPPQQYETLVLTNGYVVIKVSRISFIRYYAGQWKVEAQTSSGPLRIQVRISSAVFVKIGFSGTQTNDFVNRLPGISSTSSTQNYITAHLPYNMFMNNGIFLESARVYSVVLDKEATTDITMFAFNLRNPDTCSNQYVSPQVTIPKLSIPNVMMVQVNGQDQYAQSIQRLFFFTPSQINCVNGALDANGFCNCNSPEFRGIDCNTIICNNGGTSDGSVCYCPPGYWGDLCEKMLTPIAVVSTTPNVLSTMGPTTSVAPSPSNTKPHFSLFICDKSLNGAKVIENQLNIITAYFNTTGNVSTSLLVESQGQNSLTNNYTVVQPQDYTSFSNKVQNVRKQTQSKYDVTFLSLILENQAEINLGDTNTYTTSPGIVLLVNSNLLGQQDTLSTLNNIKQSQNNGLKILAIVFDQQYQTVGTSLTGNQDSVYLYQITTNQPSDAVTWILQKLSSP
uniref:EGF-like domain-containing protein n=1 Tax=Strongyloides venezuelensis TaxID=75913 RepID=A0A0K0F178_STRVS